MQDEDEEDDDVVVEDEGDDDADAVAWRFPLQGELNVSNNTCTYTREGVQEDDGWCIYPCGITYIHRTWFFEFFSISRMPSNTFVMS